MGGSLDCKRDMEYDVSFSSSPDTIPVEPAVRPSSVSDIEVEIPNLGPDGLIGRPCVTLRGRQSVRLGPYDQPTNVP